MPIKFFEINKQIDDWIEIYWDKNCDILQLARGNKIISKNINKKDLINGFHLDLSDSEDLYLSSNNFPKNLTMKLNNIEIQPSKINFLKRFERSQSIFIIIILTNLINS